MGRALLNLKLNGTAHHHIAQLLLVGVLNVDGANALALAQNGAPVCHRHNFVQLVGNEQNGLALFGEGTHDFH